MVAGANTFRAFVGGGGALPWVGRSITGRQPILSSNGKKKKN